MSCIDKLIASFPEIHNYLRDKAGVDFDPKTGKGKEAWIKAAKDLQEHTLNSIHDIYKQIKLSGYEKLKIDPTEGKQSTVVGDNKKIERGKGQVSHIGKETDVLPKLFNPENRLLSKEGNPIKLYHNSNELFDVFKKTKEKDSRFGAGVYFNFKPEYKGEYTYVANAYVSKEFGDGHIRSSDMKNGEVIVYDPKDIVITDIFKNGKSIFDESKPITNKELIPETKTEPEKTEPDKNDNSGKGGNPPEGDGQQKEEPEPERVTNIRKANQLEIKKVANAYENQKRKSFGETIVNGLAKIIKANPSKSVYDSALATLSNLTNGNYGDLTRDEAAGVMLYLKHETGAKRSELSKDINSNDLTVRQSALLQDEPLKDVYDNASLMAKNITTEAGRTLVFTQADLFDDEHGLQVRRMDLVHSNGGQKLSPEDEKWAKDNWEKEKAIHQKIQETREASMQENFNKEIEKLHKEYADKLKAKGAKVTDKTTREKTLSQSGKELADKIRKFKSPGGSLQTDITFGLRNLAVEAVAQIVEKGAKLADAIKQVLQDEKFKGLNEEDLTNHLVEIASRKTPEETLQKIKDYVKDGGETDVTKEMVGKNLIKDYVDSHIGEHDQKDILDKAAKDLKEVLPDIDKKKLIEAYLKEGDFKQDTKKDLQGGIAKQKKQLTSIAKLEEDIDDLKGYKTQRQRNFPTERERSEYEQKLSDEKAAIIKENNDRKNKIIDENRKLETERNRQLKIVSDLKDKKAKLEQGIIENKEKLERSTDTPEIEGLRKEVKDLEKGIREADAAQKAAERKLERDRNSGIKKYNKMLETERNRQLQKVQDLTDKKEKLEKGIRDQKSKTPTKPDTPEIEDLKKQVSEVDKQLREGENRAKEIDSKAQANKDKNAELDANIKRAQAGQDIIKTFKNKSEKEVDEEIESKTRQLKKAINDNTPEDKAQENLLKKAKENAIKKTKEFQRKIDEGDFEEPTTRTLNQHDAELIRLQKEQYKVEGEFRERQDALRQNNKSNWEVLADFGRSAFVAYLLRKPVTLGKILIATMVRPTVEIGTRKLLIPVFDKLFPGIGKAALAGGESSSWRSMKLGIKAYFNQLGARGIEKMAAKSEAKFQKANREYEDYKTNIVDNLKGSGATEKSIEFSNEKLAKLKKIRDERMFGTLGNLVYQFIGGSSIKDALIAFVHRTNEIERQFGKIHGEGVEGTDKISQSDSFKEIGKKLSKQIINGNVKTYEDLKRYNPQVSVSKEVFQNIIDEIDYNLGFIGRSHSAAKTFSGRYSFAAGFMARIESAFQKGQELTADKILEIAHEAYFDWDSGKYQQGNPISDNWNKFLNHMGGLKDSKGNPSTTGKIFKGLLGTEVAIQRVPVNMLIEEVKEFTLGAFTSVIKSVKAESKASGELEGEGLIKNSKEFKEALHERLSELDGMEAATIVRAFRKGTLGLGLYALVATLVGVKFGIFPHLGQKKKKPEDQLAPGELNPGQVMFGNTKLGETASSLIEHQPALFTMFFGSGMMQSYHDQIKKGKTTPEAVAQSFHTHMNILIGDVPQLTVVQPIKERTVDPAINYVIKQGLGADHQGFTKEDAKDPTLKYYFDKGVEFTPFNPSKIDIPKKGKLSELPEEKWEEYNTEKKKVLKRELYDLKNEIFYVTPDDKVHTEEPDEGKFSRKKLGQLTVQQLKKVIVPAETKATEAAKEKLSKEK